MKMRHLLSVLALACAPALAMDFTQRDDTLIMSGNVLPGDDVHFSAFTGVKHVLLRDSPGGNVSAATAIGYAIRDAKIGTSVEGYCNSACALIFLGGVERTITPRSTIGFHGCTKRDGGYAGEENTRLIDYAIFMTEGKFDPALADTTFHELRGDDLLLVGRGAVRIIREGKITRMNYTELDLGVVTPRPVPQPKPLINFWR